MKQQKTWDICYTLPFSQYAIWIINRFKGPEGKMQDLLLLAVSFATLSATRRTFPTVAPVQTSPRCQVLLRQRLASSRAATLADQSYPLTSGTRGAARDR